MKKKELNQAQTSALEAIKLMQNDFVLKFKPSYGAKLDDQIRSYLAEECHFLDKEFKDYPDNLKFAILEMTLSPLVQLAEIKGLGAAVVFAERIIQLENANESYVKFFQEQISKVTLDNKITRSQHILLQTTLANFVTFFTDKYSLHRFRAKQLSLDIIDQGHQNKVRKDISNYCMQVTKHAIIFLNRQAKSEHKNLEHLKQVFLREEARATPANQWQLAINLRKQAEEDAELARTFTQETIGTINFMINDLMEKLDYDAEKVKMWIDKGINLISCINHNHTDYINLSISLPSISGYMPTSRIPPSFNRYSQLIQDFILLQNLSRNGLDFTPEKLLALNPKCIAFLTQYFKEHYSTPNLFTSWNISMLNNVETMIEFKSMWSPNNFDDYATLASLSQKELTQLLEILLNLPYAKLNIKENYTRVKQLHAKTSDFRLVKWMLNIPQCYLTQELKVLHFLFNLSDTAQKNCFSIKPSNDLNRFIQDLANTTPPIAKEKLEVIFTTPYLLARENLNTDREIAFILKTNLPLDKLKTVFCAAEERQSTKSVFSRQGIQCHEKGYCSYETQLSLNPLTLGFLQALMLKTKSALHPETIRQLSSKSSIQAFQSNFLDADYLASCTVEEIWRIPSLYSKARQLNIKSVWSPEFSKLICAQKKQEPHGRPTHFPFFTQPKKAVHNQTVGENDSVSSYEH